MPFRLGKAVFSRKTHKYIHTYAFKLYKDGLTNSVTLKPNDHDLLSIWPIK